MKDVYIIRTMSGWLNHGILGLLRSCVYLLCTLKHTPSTSTYSMYACGEGTCGAGWDSWWYVHAQYRNVKILADTVTRIAQTFQQPTGMPSSVNSMHTDLATQSLSYWWYMSVARLDVCSDVKYTQLKFNVYRVCMYLLFLIMFFSSHYVDITTYIHISLMEMG